MRSSRFSYAAKDGKQIAACMWLPDMPPRGLVQIVHGIGEHMQRYADFASELVSHGFGVYAEDHRGHGETAGSVEALGWFAETDGWDLVVDDLYRLTQRMRTDHPKPPLFLLGHSMGSLLSRSYIVLHGEDLAGVILSGTAGDPGLLGVIGGALARREVRKVGSRAKSVRLNRIAFGAYNKRIVPHRTDFDWISRDTIVVDRYMADPYCGFIPSASLFKDLLEGVLAVNRFDLIRRIPAKLPVFIFSGDADPVGAYGKGVQKVAALFKKAGVKDVTLRLYRECRHECLNELNRAEVYHDVIDWINAHMEVRR